ncbi:GNAT family N-acetyltransferase [Colidextribacter sp. OB.20]|uniref:GNAT family N-acetyltransferase n=1 Tax=Colidextribacter sp. OB.20 TaxID=2304568 RepID=UPI00136D6F2E|nr:GNAT family N-acetyltransferase [Colidextribacter sp. OB.20]
MNEKLAALFACWEAPMVRASLQGVMGRVERWGEDSALASIGDFCFLAGEPVRALVEQADAPILVPGSEGWARLIEDTLREGASPFTRYATRRPPEGFSRRRLLSFTEALPQGFCLHPIGREFYFTLMEEEWARDLCGCFDGEEDFLERGLGFVVTQGGGLPLAGAASYAAYDGAIEIEIDTRPDFRRLGLASACGARLILECLARGIYPGWDAHDRRSLALAEKLGYQLDRPYTAYWVESKRRGYFLRESEN